MKPAGLQFLVAGCAGRRLLRPLPFPVVRRRRRRRVVGGLGRRSETNGAFFDDEEMSVVPE